RAGGVTTGGAGAGCCRAWRAGPPLTWWPRPAIAMRWPRSWRSGPASGRAARKRSVLLGQARRHPLLDLGPPPAPAPFLEPELPRALQVLPEGGLHRRAEALVQD